MRRFTSFVIDRNGNAVHGAEIKAYEPGTNTPVTMYATDGVGSPIASVTTDSEGEFGFYAANQRIDIRVTLGIFQQTVPDEVMFDPSDGIVVGLPGSVVKNVNSVVSAKALIGLADGEQVNLTGYYAAADGGGGALVYDSASSATADDGTVFALNTLPGRLLRASSGYITAQQFGAKGDDVTNDFTPLSAANTTLNGLVGELIFSAGKVYKVSSNLTFGANVTLRFEHGAKLSPDVGVTVTALGPVISFGGVPFTGAGTFTAQFGKLCLTAGGSFGIGTTNPNVHAGDDGTTTRVCTVLARTAPLFIGATDRADGIGLSVASFEGYWLTQAPPHDELGAFRVITEGATAGQRGGACSILTKADGSTSFTEKLRIHANGNALLGGGVSSANRAGAGAGSVVLTISGTTDHGVLELATNKADASSISAGDLLFIHNQNTTGEKRVARIQSVTAGATATDRGGHMIFFTKADGGALTERMRIDDFGTVALGAGTSAGAPFRIPHGVAPSSPGNGDMWTTTAGLFVRINGATVGPLS